MSKPVTLKLYIAFLTLFVIVMNILANAMPFFGNTTGEISARYETLFTPAGITFSIWGVIYALSVLFALRFFTYDIMTHRTMCLRIAKAYTGLSLANVVWLFLWHAELIIVSSLVLFIALACAIYLALHYRMANTIERTFFTIYAAWLSVAAIANVTIVIVASTITLPFSPLLWTIAVLIIASLISFRASITLKSQAFTAVILWAFFGIALRHAPHAPNQETPLFITTFLLMGVLIITLFLQPKEKPAKTG